MPKELSENQWELYESYKELSGNYISMKNLKGSKGETRSNIQIRLCKAINKAIS